MKATDFMQIFELGKAFKTPKAMKRNRRIRDRDLNFDDFDIASLLHRKLQEADTLQKLLSDREKAHKKEDKKDEKQKLSLHHVAFLFALSFPIIAPMYVQYLKQLLH
jgi:hypothetical protein